MKTSRKSVLIITYYWPPSGGPGVQRSLYFVKYLREFGWEPIVYTVANGEYPYRDESLEKQIPKDIQILKVKAWEPFSIYKKFMGMHPSDTLKPNIMVEKTNRPWFQKVATFIRGNFFIPDARMFWIKSSVRFLSKYLKEHPVDLVLTSSPPHSVQLIGLHIQRKFGIPWLADFRDPWSKIYFWDKLKMTTYAKQRNIKLEKMVLHAADRIMTVSPGCARDFEQIAGQHVKVISNGFDEVKGSRPPQANQRLIMAYGGTLSGDRNPEILWKTLADYLKEHPEIALRFQLQFIGAIDPAVFESLKSFNLGSYLEIFPALNHEDYLDKINEAQLLLLIGAKDQQGVITGKFFEYLALKKPILSISPQASDLEVILNQTKSGINVDFDDAVRMRKALDELFQIVLGLHDFVPQHQEIEKYSRRNLTAQLADLMNEMISANE